MPLATRVARHRPHCVMRRSFPGLALLVQGTLKRGKHPVKSAGIAEEGACVLAGLGGRGRLSVAPLVCETLGYSAGWREHADG